MHAGGFRNTSHAARISPQPGRRKRTIVATCSFAAPPVPVTARFTCLEAYSETGSPAWLAASRITPLAWPSFSEESGLRLTTVSSTAASSGRQSATIAARPS